jgi:hypothetical protein
MRFNHLVFFLIFVTASVFAQEIKLEYFINTPILNQSNTGYRIFFGTQNGAYYYKQPLLRTNSLPVIKVSPLGGETFIVMDNRLGIYDNWIFTMAYESRNNIKDLQVKKILANEFGDKYFLIAANGSLYETEIAKENIKLRKKDLPHFVSEGDWNNNFKKLLLADDYYVYYYSPESGDVSNRLKLPSGVTSIKVNTKEFDVLVGLTNGQLFIYSQDLSTAKQNLVLSKAPLTSIEVDPLDHYAYVGDEDGFVYTVDLLKNKVINTQELHKGAVTVGMIDDLTNTKRYIVTSGNDKRILLSDVSDLEPNYKRIVTKLVESRKNQFIKQQSGEKAVDYDKRVNDASVKSFVESTTTSIVDSLAQVKSSKNLKYLIANDSLSVILPPFPLVKFKLLKPVASIDELSLQLMHFSLEKDNTFAINELEIKSKEGVIKFSSDSRKMVALEQEYSLEVAKKIASKEQDFKNSLADLVAALRSKGKLNDVELTVEAHLKVEKDSLGQDELNLHVVFLSQGIKANIEKETADYKAGKYDIFESVAATTLVDFFIKSTSEKLGEYLVPNTKITFNLTGSTDKSKINNALPYANEYGPFKNFPYYFQGQLSGLNLTQEEGITQNSQLGFLRTYSVRNFMETSSDIFDETRRKYVHFSEESDQFGPEYRRIKIEMIIHRIMEMNKIPTDLKAHVSVKERALSEIDVNIPTGKKNEGYALVFGNEDYSSFQPNLTAENNVPYAVRDGETFSNYLRELYGFEKENVVFLRNATYGTMNQAIARLERLMEIDGKGKEIVIFYSGHGMPEEKTKEPYLIPIDISGNNVNQGVSLKNLMSRLSAKPHGKITFIIDACFSGLGKVEPIASVKGITVTPVNPELGPNMILMTSSSGNESSIVDDQNQHGLFTYHLLKRLQEAKGEISIDALFNLVRKDVALTAIKKLNKIQTPSILIGKDIEQKVKTMLLIGQ